MQAGTPRALEIELKPGSNYLGRGFSNDFKIEDPSVSGSHAQIVVDGEVIVVKDLGSTNGTFINRSQVKEGFLQPGQALHLGAVELRVVGTTVTAGPATPPMVPPEASIPPRGTLVNGARQSASGAPRTPMPRSATTAAAPPPPSAPAPAGPAEMAEMGEMMEAPKGKTVCKFHHKVAGQWLCHKCNELFCSLCVTTRRTEAGPGIICRKCGTQCAPVRVKHVAKKEKELKVYSDGVILGRSLGFGLGGALLSAAIWIGLSWVMGFDVPFLFCPLAGVICGYAVKLASQDRPGAIFSTIALVYCIIGSVAGKVGMIFATGLNTYSTTSLLTSLIGLMVGGFLAWKFGGGDF
jgi:hypothetical protein